MKFLLILGVIILFLFFVLKTKSTETPDVSLNTSNEENAYELPCIDAKARLLTEEDTGKVFIAVSDKAERINSKCGKYKLLFSVHNGMYSFKTFDIIDGKAIRKTITDQFTSPSYKQVNVDNIILEDVITASRGTSLFDNLKNKMENMVGNSKPKPKLYNRFKEKGYTVETFVPSSSSQPQVWTIKIYKKDYLVTEKSIPMNDESRFGADAGNDKMLENEADRMISQLP